jgi:hypothetical protein
MPPFRVRDRSGIRAAEGRLPEVAIGCRAASMTLGIIGTTLLEHDATANITDA